MPENSTAPEAEIRENDLEWGKAIWVCHIMPTETTKQRQWSSASGWFFAGTLSGMAVMSALLLVILSRWTCHL